MWVWFGVVITKIIAKSGGTVIGMWVSSQITRAYFTLRNEYVVQCELYVTYVTGVTIMCTIWPKHAQAKLHVRTTFEASSRNGAKNVGTAFVQSLFFTRASATCLYRITDVASASFGLFWEDAFPMYWCLEKATSIVAKAQLIRALQQYRSRDFHAQHTATGRKEGCTD